MKPHKHAELIKAWADGIQLQYKNVNNEWQDLDTEIGAWFPHVEYRIKPEPKPEPRKQWMYIYNNATEAKTWISPITPDHYQNVSAIAYIGKIEVYP